MPLHEQKGLYIIFQINGHIYLIEMIFIVCVYYVCFWLGVPHHLLGTVSPDAEFTVKDFRDKAIPVRAALFAPFISLDMKLALLEFHLVSFGCIYLFWFWIIYWPVFQLIDDILSRNHLPVIVGGTNYYIQVLQRKFHLSLVVNKLVKIKVAC